MDRFNNLVLGCCSLDDDDDNNNNKIKTESLLSRCFERGQREDEQSNHNETQTLDPILSSLGSTQTGESESER